MTWSIVARDPKTGAFGVAVASGIPSSGTLVPHIQAGVGAVAAQGLVTTPYGNRVLSMLGGRLPDEIIKSLVTQDGSYDQRQFHLINADGENSAYTGEQCGDFAGQIVRPGVSVAGNLLAGPEVLNDTLKAFNAAAGAPLPERLMAALIAGQAAGGDIRGVRSAGLTVVLDQKSPPLRITSENSPDPIGVLFKLYARSMSANQSQQGGYSAMNNQRFPLAPGQGAFSAYSYMNPSAQLTPDQRRQQMAQKFAQQLIGQPTQGVAHGIGQLIAGAGLGLAKYRDEGQQFPAAPGGAQPSFASALGNFFTGRNNGGLY